MLMIRKSWFVLMLLFLAPNTWVLKHLKPFLGGPLWSKNCRWFHVDGIRWLCWFGPMTWRFEELFGSTLMDTSKCPLNKKKNIIWYNMYYVSNIIKQSSFFASLPKSDDHSSAANNQKGLRDGITAKPSDRNPHLARSCPRRGPWHFEQRCGAIASQPKKL